ncbi:TetR/AcrR family transcriptional regulator (plasmid) [Agrobacterium tumefaciens]|uniref:TetR/AcrR family transcriptional regulator n=2 Tax=Agrobacterium tumefaciens TaxID=358 RepID=UPI0021D157A0|nr:TetR/AcrR family transcriptional regulator [Agrobacterium tumefaciens]NTZ64233.1 TetR/AcrR family transcriptional regulator [Agrobacterium tumefaciens]UXT00179.1 TetR/AcrR family transcriptional regulator [Agrobacterium tumefaciens]UXT00349.1 TetR/AcrR family transcriptional regulator [Agrobacterium tumefaciens]UXT52879.1 TetR/AcrR family transcriptional regulator [Agrobacterium tumefaciens]UXT68940.1 TetR/AcrR family transcriptional regulator [Agrobacterium tumefaciens]
MARPQEFDRHNVLNRAMELFWNKGYEATSLTDILQATGLSKSSLYGSFGDKREFFLAAYDAYREDRADQMDALLNSGSARQAIESFFRQIIEDAAKVEFSNGCMSTNQAVELAPHDAVVRHRVETDFKLIEDALTRTIERGQREGSVTRNIDARKMAHLLVVAFPGFQVMVRAGGGRTRLRDALDLLMKQLD